MPATVSRTLTMQEAETVDHGGNQEFRELRAALTAEARRTFAQHPEAVAVIVRHPEGWTLDVVDRRES